MNTLKQKRQSLLADEQGATAVEYGLMIALIAAVILTTVGLLGTELNTKFTSMDDAVMNAVSTGTGG